MMARIEWSQDQIRHPGRGPSPRSQPRQSIRAASREATDEARTLLTAATPNEWRTNAATPLVQAPGRPEVNQSVSELTPERWLLNP